MPHAIRVVAALLPLAAFSASVIPLLGLGERMSALSVVIGGACAVVCAALMLFAPTRGWAPTAILIAGATPWLSGVVVSVLEMTTAARREWPTCWDAVILRSRAVAGALETGAQAGWLAGALLCALGLSLAILGRPPRIGELRARHALVGVVACAPMMALSVYARMGPWAGGDPLLLFASLASIAMISIALFAIGSAFRPTLLAAAASASLGFISAAAATVSAFLSVRLHAAMRVDTGMRPTLIESVYAEQRPIQWLHWGAGLAGVFAFSALVLSIRRASRLERAAAPRAPIAVFAAVVLIASVPQLLVRHVLDVDLWDALTDHYAHCRRELPMGE